MIQMARALGAGRIVATDVVPARLEMARRFGADATRGGRRARPDRAVAGVQRRPRFRAGAGLQRRPPRRQQALEVADLGGTVLFFAPLDPGETLALEMNDLWKRGVNIVHSYAGPPADMQRALELIAARELDVASMITHRLGLADTAEAFRLMLKGGDSLKVIIEPQR